MLRPSPLRVAVPLVAVAVLLAGCGGGNSALSSADFARAGNNVCIARAKQLAKEGAALFAGKKSTAQQVTAFYLDHYIPIARQDFDEIAKLAPPASEKAAVTAMLAAGRLAIDQVETELKSNPTGGTSNQQTNLLLATFNNQAVALGLTACAGQSAAKSAPKTPPAGGAPATTVVPHKP